MGLNQGVCQFRKATASYTGLLILLLLSFSTSSFAAPKTGTLTWTDSIDEQWENTDPCYVKAYQVNYRLDPADPSALMQYYDPVKGWINAESGSIIVTLPSDSSSDTNSLEIQYDSTKVYYFSIQAIDNRGLKSDSSDEVATDATPPNAPTNVSRISPANDNTVEFSWTAATDPSPGSGIAGYSIVFDTTATTTPDATIDVQAPSTTVTSAKLADGSNWYLHIVAIDGAGLVSPVVHIGPFLIDTVPPSILPYPSTQIDFDTSPPTLFVGYSENDMQSATAASNYSLNFGIGNPTADGTDVSGGNANRFSFPLPAAVKTYTVYTLTVNGSVTDLATNPVVPNYATLNDANGDGLGDKWESDWQAAHGSLPDPNGDADGDGLTNIEEASHYGTNPESTDTDGDGMPDAYEVQYGLNPIANDWYDDLDGDTINNGTEFTLGTDPSNAAPLMATLIYPGNNATDIPTSFDLKVDPNSYSDPEGDAHSTTVWQISKTGNWTTATDLVLTEVSSQHLYTFPVLAGMLEPGSSYFWRAGFNDAANGGVRFAAGNYFTMIPRSASDDPGSIPGIPDAQEVDGTVDLNHNGIADNIENTDDYKAVITAGGTDQIGIEKGANTSKIVSLRWIDPATISDTNGKPTSMPLGMISFKIEVTDSSQPANVRVYFSRSVPVGWYKYDPEKGWQEYTSHATYNADGSVTLELLDGGYGDADGVANGVIVDPSGPGTGGATAGTGGGEGGGGGCFIETVARGSSAVHTSFWLVVLLAAGLVLLTGFGVYKIRHPRLSDGRGRRSDKEDVAPR